MKYISTKQYGHELGLSCAFRQWKADSHCKYIHGYALAFKFKFETDTLDSNNWVVDFGNLKELKKTLEGIFDHKVLIATDDPHIDYFRQGHELGVIDMIEVMGNGCEKMAEMVFDIANGWLLSAGYKPRVKLLSVEVKEHGSNSAIYSV